jgi:hypothetical protein
MRARILKIFVLSSYLALLMAAQGLCDVSPGDVVDKTNWEKVEGLVPEEFLGWIKKGDFVLQIGELKYKARDFQPPYALNALSANRGKYALDEGDWIGESTLSAIHFRRLIRISRKRPKRWCTTYVTRNTSEGM